MDTGCEHPYVSATLADTGQQRSTHRRPDEAPGRQRSGDPGLWQRGLNRAGTPVLHFLGDSLAVLSHRANSLNVFNVSPQDFAYAPGLCHASSRTVGRVAIEDL